MKLNLQDKLNIIILYEQGFSNSKLSKKYKVCKTTIERIERQYREHGIGIFKKKGKNTKYTADFKLSIVKRVLNGESQSGIAAELAVNKWMIHSWVRKYKELGYNGLTNKQGRPKKTKTNNESKQTKNSTPMDDKDRKIKELEERNAQLEMENDLLKKLRVLVQQRTQPQSKKK